MKLLKELCESAGCGHNTVAGLLVVSHIDERGLLRLVPLGGHDPRNMVAQRVVVRGKKRDLPGLLYPGIKPPHIQTEAGRNVASSP